MAYRFTGNGCSDATLTLDANLATKADIARVEAAMEALRQETRAGIAGVEASMEALQHETEATIGAVKADLVKWLSGALVAQGGLIVAFVKLLQPARLPRRGNKVHDSAP